MKCKNKKSNIGYEKIKNFKIKRGDEIVGITKHSDGFIVATRKSLYILRDGGKVIGN